MTSDPSTKLCGTFSSRHTACTKWYSSFRATHDRFHTSASMSSDPVDLPLFSFFIALSNSSLVRSPSASFVFARSVSYASLTSSSSVALYSPARNLRHTSDSSPTPLINSPCAVTVGCVRLALRVVPVSVLTASLMAFVSTVSFTSSMCWTCLVTHST